MKKNLLSFAITIVLAIFNCSAQFPNWGWGPAITVTPNGSSITCSVYDPVLSQNMTANYSNASGYINSQGVVAWTYNSSAHAVVYDVVTHSFNYDYWSHISSTFSNFSNNDGVVAWVNGTTANAAVYDASTHQWDYDYWSHISSTFSNFSNNKGIVAWVNGTTANVAIYDGSSHQWDYDYWSHISSTFSNFSNNEGIVAWTNGTAAHVAVYNFFSHQWDYDYWSHINSTFTNFSNQYGIVAWTNGTTANAAVFDPVTEQWDYDYWSYISSTFSNFNTANGTLTYTNGSTNYQKGYNINSHQWQDSYTTNIYCRFYNSTSSGNAPLITYFNCLSIGANSYSYSCGDGHTITRRWAWKQYNNSGNYSPELTVLNTSNNTTCNSTVNVDVGIEEYGMNDVVIFPNPVINEMEIRNPKFEIRSVQIYDAIGQSVFSGKPATRSQQLTINVSNFSHGIYFMKVKGDAQERIVKFVKQ